MPADGRQTKIPALRTVREFRVIYSQTVQERRMKIVDVNRVVDWVVPQFVRVPDGLSSPNASPREPDAKALPCDDLGRMTSYSE